MRRLLWRASKVVLVVLVSVAVCGLPVYVFPMSDSLSSDETALVLGPPSKERIQFARQALADGEIARLLVSVDPHRTDQSVCRLERSQCFVPQPFTTLGEVLLAKKIDQTSDEQLVVITKTPHVSRTRFILWQCGVTAKVIGVPAKRMTLFDWAYEYAYQTAAFGKAALLGCDTSEFAGYPDIALPRESARAD